MARHLHTPVPAIEDMYADELIAYHLALIELLEQENTNPDPD